MMGVKNHECTRIEYKHGGSILHIQTQKDKICCPRCGKKDFVNSGTVVRDFKSLPMGNRPITLRKTVQRIYCSHCGCTVQEEIPFAKGKCQYTKKLGRYIQDLCMYMTIKSVADTLGLHMEGILAYYVMNSEETPMKDKLTIFGALAYIVLPIDLINAKRLPIIGWIDEVVSLAVAVQRMQKYITHEMERKTDETLDRWFPEYTLYVELTAI